jgi:uncharacterized membrane protein YkoI
MKIKMIICSALATALLTGCVNINVGGQSGSCKKMEKGEKGEKAEKEEKGEAKNKEASQSELMAQAKISKEAAQQTAQAQVPNGTAKESELEMEKGKLIWSFAFTIPDSKDIKEVNIDAVTGDMVGAIETETPADQAKEATEDAAKPKQGEDKDDKD